MNYFVITHLASMIDGEKLRECDDTFDHIVSDEFADATKYLGTLLCAEADGIYEAVMRKMKIEHVRRLLKYSSGANEKLLDLATEIAYVSHKAFFELDALHKGNFTDEDYFVWNMHCEHENQLEADEAGFREWAGEEVHFPESRFAWWDGMPIPIGYSPDQLNEVWEFLTPLLEFVDTEYWGLKPKILWEGCRFAGIYGAVFWEDFDDYVSKAHMNEFAISLLEQFGSLDGIKRYLIDEPINQPEPM